MIIAQIGEKHGESGFAQLWTTKYSPSTYLDLISDEVNFVD